MRPRTYCTDDPRYKIHGSDEHDTTKELVNGRALAAQIAFNELRKTYGWSIEGTQQGIKKQLALLRELEVLIRAHKQTILRTVAEEKGRNEFTVEVTEYIPTLSLINDYLRSAYKTLKPENRSRVFSFAWGNKKLWVTKEPFGIIGIVSPSNHPFSLPIGAALSALLTGNAVILKPATETPKTNLLVGDLVSTSLMNSGLPKDFFSVLPTDLEYGKALVRCPAVGKIHFTGSVQGGWAVSRANAETRLTPPTLELGGSNAAIVLEDADIETAAKVIVWARTVAMSCNNIKRVFVVEAVGKKLWDTLYEMFRETSDAEVAEKFSDREFQNYRDFRKDAERQIYGFAETIPFPKRSLRCWPTLIPVHDYRRSSAARVLREETFSPILPVVWVGDEEEAIRCAENTIFGLGASIFTRDKRRAEQIACQLKCGCVSHNDAMTEFSIPGIPFGGWKQSGIGYVHGPEGLLEFVQKKSLLLERWSAPKLHLFPWTKKKKKWLRKLSKLIIKLS